MDPLSIATGVLGVLAASDQAVKCMRKLRTIRHANAEIARVAEEVAELHSILGHVPAVVAHGRAVEQGLAPGPDPSRLLPAVDTLGAIGHRIAGKLERLTALVPELAAESSVDAAPRPARKTLAARVKARERQWKWSRARTQVLQIQADLRSLQLNLLAGLGMVGTIASYTGLQLLSGSSSAVANGDQVGLERTAEILNAASDDATPTTNTQSMNLTTTSDGQDANAGNLRAQGVFDAAVGEASLSEHGYLTREDRTTASAAALTRRRFLSGPAGTLTRRDVFPRRSAYTNVCEAWCSCVCHSESVLRVRGPGSQYFGKLFICSNGMIFGFRSCNETTCRGNTRSIFRLNYHPPKWLCNSGFRLQVTSDPQYGPELYVHLPRVIDFHAPALKLAVLGNTQAVEEMFSDRKASPWDVDPIHGSLLHYATDRAYWHMARFLIERGAPVHFESDLGLTPAQQAWDHYFSGNLTEDEKLFVREWYGEEYLESQQFSLLHKTVLGLNNLDLITVLRSSTAGINAKDFNGRTCLSWAALRMDESAVDALLTFGADPGIRDVLGRTPLHYVQGTACCERLVAGGADIEATDLEGATPLHVATSPPGKPEVVESLLARGASITAVNNLLCTPIWNATYNGLDRLACALLDGLAADCDDKVLLLKILTAAAQFERYAVMRHMRRFLGIRDALSERFLETLPDSGALVMLTSAYKKRWRTDINYADEFDALLQFLKAERDRRAELRDGRESADTMRLPNGAANDTMSLHDGDEVFVDAQEYSNV